MDAGATWVDLEMERAPHRSDLSAIRALRSLMSSHDLVHLHSSKAGALGRLAVATLPASRRPACAFTPHGWSWLVGGALSPAYRAFERAASRLADAIVAVSDEDMARGLQVLGQRAAPGLRVIENGVDTIRFGPEGPSAPRSGEPLIVCIGRLSPEKGQDLAIRALAAMRTPNARLRLVGSGRDAELLAGLARRLGIADRVEFMGESRRTEEELRAADVVLVPSRYDGLSLVLLEAMSTGSAVVATRATGASALEGVGVLVDVGDPGTMAEAVDEMLADPGRREKLGGAARDRVIERYSLAESTDRTMALWHELAA